MFPTIWAVYVQSFCGLTFDVVPWHIVKLFFMQSMAFLNRLLYDVCGTYQSFFFAYMLYVIQYNKK